MRVDIELALALATRRLPDLIHVPKRLRPARFRVGSRTLGRYNRFTDSLQLNARYLGVLDDEEAHELLDTVIHELLHANSSLLKQLRDTLLPHPDIYAEAKRRADALWGEFDLLRKANNKPQRLQREEREVSQK